MPNAQYFDLIGIQIEPIKNQVITLTRDRIFVPISGRSRPIRGVVESNEQ
jgi:hypothetical protein